MAKTIGFSSVALPPAGTYVQLPDINCEEVALTIPNMIFLSDCATPGDDFLPLRHQVEPVTLKTGGNASNLFIASRNSTSPQTLRFMCVADDAR